MRLIVAFDFAGALTWLWHTRLLRLCPLSGTGKSFVGALLTKALYDFTDEVILCVCFTNHALDQFLLDLLDHGIPETSMVRIGGSDKIDQRLNNVRLRNLTESQAETQASRKEFGILKSSIEQAMMELEEFDGLRESNLLRYLQSNEKQWARRFLVQPNLTDADGMKIVGQKGKPVTQYSLLGMHAKSARQAGPALLTGSSTFACICVCVLLRF